MVFDDTATFTPTPAYGDDVTVENAQSKTASSFASLSNLIVAELEVEKHLPVSRTMASMHGFVGVVRDAARCLSTIMPDGSVEERCAQLFSDRLESFGQSNGLPNVTDNSAGLAQASGQTFAVFYNLTVNQNPFSHTSNKEYADWLFAAVTSIEPVEWDHIMYLRTWMCVAADQFSLPFFSTAC